jgi:hypothetical protein
VIRAAACGARSHRSSRSAFGVFMDEQSQHYIYLGISRQLQPKPYQQLAKLSFHSPGEDRPARAGQPALGPHARCKPGDPALTKVEQQPSHRRWIERGQFAPLQVGDRSNSAASGSLRIRIASPAASSKTAGRCGSHSSIRSISQSIEALRGHRASGSPSTDLSQRLPCKSRCCSSSRPSQLACPTSSGESRCRVSSAARLQSGVESIQIKGSSHMV